MKKATLLCSILISSFLSVAQCTMEPFSVQKRVYLSDLLIEGRIISSESFWNDNHSFIYTANEILVSKLFQGNQELIKDGKITMITEGGQVGFDALTVEPALDVKNNDVGIFFLKQSVLKGLGCKTCSTVVFEGVASEQSFIKYDELTLIAHGYYEKYDAIKAALYPKIEGYTEKKYQEISTIQIGTGGIRSLTAPVISSIDIDTLASGTGTLLTITGSNFGIIQNTGRVEFVDPNYGDGRYFDPGYPSSYKSWKSTKIEVYVPSRAGTGTIRVTNTNDESTVSSSKIYVKYAHSNVGYSGATGIDSGFYQVNHINDNTNGGYTWVFNNKFAARGNAVNAFLRAAETWRCETLMNWDVGSNTSTDVIARDNENVVRLTKFGDSRLGVCYSWYSGCFNGGNVYWYVTELDVDFDSTRNWYYGTGTPGKSQIDFETVATHELGHGHQLSHVIDNTKIMNYSLGAGDRNVNLSDSDIEGGDYVRVKSLAGDPCGPGKYKAIKASDCNITKPEALIVASNLVVCPGIAITFSDSSKGKVNSYNWLFGTDASITSASTAGPHSISYSSSGIKSIRLIVANDFGIDTFFQNISVAPDTPEAPIMLAYDDTACIGKSTYMVNKVTDASSYKWSIGSGGVFIGPSTDTSSLINWNTVGTGHKLSVVAINSCGTSAETAANIEVIDVAKAAFTTSDMGLTIEFDNSSSNATEYMWYWGDGDSLVSKHPSNPSHKYPTKGEYSVKLIAKNFCSESIEERSITVNYGVGVSTISFGLNKIYPNPSSGFVIIESVNQEASINIYDKAARLVCSYPISFGINNLNLKHLTDGLYTIELISKNDEHHFAKLMLIN